MDIAFPHAADEINVVIGRAVSSLIASGKPVDAGSILEQLKQSEKMAIDGMKVVYASAIKTVAASLPALAG